MKRINKIILFTLLLPFLFYCENKNITSPSFQTLDYSKSPEGFPPIPFPKENPYSNEKELLGRYLFFDKIFHKDSLISCASCHNPRFAFAGNVPNPIGGNGIALSRNAISLLNVAYRKTLNWDGISISLEEAIYDDFTNPKFFNNDTNEIFNRLQRHPLYPLMFEKAFGNGSKPYPYLAAQALATFVRTLVTGNSPFDNYLRGNPNALNSLAKKGKDLFFSEKTGCSKCHSGFLFTDEKFHNTGTTTHYFDFGLYYLTGKNSDRGKFKTPSLRNVALTSPYLIDGSYFTLEEIIENYNRGGLPFFNKDTLIKPLNLTSEEKKALIEFLKSLSDTAFINSPRFSTFGY
ncbi:MAG: cytochrome-c peroxidase [Candidatus Kapaibacteriales bacterium]